MSDVILGLFLCLLILGIVGGAIICVFYEKQFPNFVAFVCIVGNFFEGLVTFIQFLFIVVWFAGIVFIPILGGFGYGIYLILKGLGIINV